jgi:hypothetical protein
LIEGDAAASIAAIGRISASAFSDPEGLLYLTRHLAHLDEGDAGLELFERGVRGGFFCYPAMATDPWLDPVRKRPEFVTLLHQAKEQHQSAKREFDRLGGDRILGIATRAETA